MKNFFKFLAKIIVKGVAYFFVFLNRIKIYSFPNGLFIFSKFNKILNLLISDYTNISTAKFLRHGSQKNYYGDNSEILKDPFLRFQALWSIGNGSVNTPCPQMLACDLASLVDLKEKKILCIGSKNHYETNLLVLRGANRKLITNIDLYSNVPGILPMDFHHLEFADETFDIIFWAGSFVYAKDLQQAASQAIRVVKKPGIIAVGDSLLGGATRDVLLAGQPSIKNVLDCVSDDVETFTKRLDSIEQMEKYFINGALSKANVLLTRKYLPNHANLIMSYISQT
jgi:hypothetical protein